jgi:hypothetical protein
MKRSTIAMAAGTAALFGLALYETFEPDPSAEELSCEALKPQIAEFEALQRAKHEHLADLFGTEVASAGVRFTAVHIGEPAMLEMIESAQHTTTPTAQDPYSMWVSDTNGTVTRIEVELGRYDEAPCEKTDDPCSCRFESHDHKMCDDFGEQLASAWGRGKDRGVWVNERTGRRATFSDCTLVFE